MNNNNIPQNFQDIAGEFLRLQKEEALAAKGVNEEMLDARGVKAQEQREVPPFVHRDSIHSSPPQQKIEVLEKAIEQTGNQAVCQKEVLSKIKSVLKEIVKFPFRLAAGAMSLAFFAIGKAATLAATLVLGTIGGSVAGFFLAGKLFAREKVRSGAIKELLDSTAQGGAEFGAFCFGDIAVKLMSFALSKDISKKMKKVDEVFSKVAAYPITTAAGVGGAAVEVALRIPLSIVAAAYGLLSWVPYLARKAASKL